MQQRRLGNSSPEVSAIRLGCTRLSFGPATDRQEAISLIRASDVESTPDDLGKIETAAAQFTPQGERYPEHLEHMTGR